MIGRTNGGTGGGGISSKNALLVVYTPLGSSVTATNGTATKTSNTGIVLSDRPTVEIHLFSISSSQYGTWTVTATRDTDTNTTTVSVTALQRYEVYIGYHVPLQLYQEVEYLQSSGTQRIDTLLTNVNGVDIGFKYNVISNNTTIYGTRSSAGGSDRFLTNIYNGKFSIVPKTNESDSLVADTEYHEIQNGYYFGWHLFFDGTDFGENVGQGSSSRNTQLFCLNDQGTLNQYSSARVYYVKFYKNDTLSRDCYPCYRLSDSVAGMWDKVNEVFLTNSGSGTFVVGGDV